MKSSNLTEQSLNNKKRDLEDAEQRRRRVLEAQLKIEEQRLKLENNVKKLDEAKSAKNKAALEKKKKEELENQRKDLKSEGQSRTKPTEDLKGIENKYSLSNLDYKEQNPTNRQDSQRFSEDLKVSSSFDNKALGLTGPKTFIREPESSEFKRYEKLSSDIGYEQDRISSQRNELLGQLSMKSQDYRKEEENEEIKRNHYFPEKNGKQNYILENWETRKSAADKLDEGELDMYRAELRDIKESLKNFDSNLMSRGVENNSSTKKLVRESIQDIQEQTSFSPVLNYNISTDPSSNKGFHRRPLSRQQSDVNETESMGNNVYKDPEIKEKIEQRAHNPLKSYEESITRRSIESSKFESQFPSETNHQKSTQKLQPDYKYDIRGQNSSRPEEMIKKSIDSMKNKQFYENEIKQEKSGQKSKFEGKQEISRNSDRGNFDEKTKLQLEISSKIKQLQSEKEKERKKNEEAALKAKQQILNQLKNKNQDYGRPSTIKEEEQEQEYLARTSENKSNQERIQNASNRFQRREELYEPEISPRSYKQEQFDSKQSFDQKKSENCIQEKEKQREWNQQEEKSQEDDEEGHQEEENQSEEQVQDEDLNEDHYEEDEEEEQSNQHSKEAFEEEKIYNSEPIQNAQREVKYEDRRFMQQDYDSRKIDESRESKLNIQRGSYKNEDQDGYYPKWSENPSQKEQLSYAQLHSRNKQSMNKNYVEPKVESSISKLVKNHEKSYQDTHQDNERNLDNERNRKDQVKGKDQSNVNIATFGRKDYEDSDEDRENNNDESKSSYEDQLDQVRVHQDSEEDIEEEQEEKNIRNREEEENYENYHRSTSNFGKHQFEPSSYTKPEINRPRNPDDAYYNKLNDNKNNLEENKSYRRNESFQEHRRSKEDYNYNYQQNLINKNQSSKQFAWTNNKPSEETSEEEEETQLGKFNAKQDDFRTADFGNDTNKPTRVRKGWGETSKGENTNTKLPSEAHLKSHSDENEDDEEGMLQSYKQKKSPHKPKKEIQEEPKQEAVVLVFDDDKDKEKKQKQYENMMKRLERNKERKERDRSVGISKKLPEKDVNDIVVSDHSGHSEETPKNVMVKHNKRIVSAMERPTNQKPPEVPNSKNSYSRKLSANVMKGGGEKYEYSEEMKSVEPSAKSTKSIVKSPGGHNNNIFQTPKTGNGAGQKKNVIGFSKQSNRLIIKNAITNVCFAGEINRKEREEVLAKVNEIKNDMNFIIVFKPISGRQDFKALYVYDSVADEIRKIYSNGNAPTYIDASQVESYYRYNSGSKEFKSIQGNKNFSLAVDAVSLQPHVFKKVPNDKLY